MAIARRFPRHKATAIQLIRWARGYIWSNMAAADIGNATDYQGLVCVDDVASQLEAISKRLGGKERQREGHTDVVNRS